MHDALSVEPDIAASVVDEGSIPDWLKATLMIGTGMATLGYALNPTKKKKVRDTSLFGESEEFYESIDPQPDPPDDPWGEFESLGFEIPAASERRLS